MVIPAFDPQQRLVRLVADLATGEVTAWPTDFHIEPGGTVIWELFATSGVPEKPDEPAVRLSAERLHEPFVVKFADPGGFVQEEVHAPAGQGRATATQQPGLYHYEVAFTATLTVNDAKQRRVFALLGCPSGTVSRTL